MHERDQPTHDQERDEEKSQHDRAPYQKNEDRDAVKSAEETKHIPNKHGAIK
jgi:hypothetical protein